ncbi:MAG TPA: hypothetical protein VM802_30465 [Chitinophaga sp.]|uniref:hypothetical protein n=1 Tax=Chitinophaga sp. TaxID=1869181 RepID=UPI002C5AD976|nr:hypothetical protein [Chitinophaga sp.]HVI49230.1 hypothetical protein [Chitinophaga sp.]
MKELSEMAVTDLLNLTPSQTQYQLQRLDSIRNRFRQFWKNYYKLPAPLDEQESRQFFFGLNLEDLFIVEGLELDGYNINCPQCFIDDVCDSVRHREEYLNDIQKAVGQIISPEKESPLPDSSAGNVNGAPIIKEHIFPQLFAILKDYFSQEEQGNLQILLQSGKLETSQLTFNGNGNQLADAFKQLYEANLIVGCTKASLEHWLLQYFAYRDKDKIKRFTGKYLNDIISSDTRNCQSPILDIKKNRESGQFEVLPTQRTKRNNKKY